MIGAPNRSARRSIGRRRMQPRSKAATSTVRKPGAGTIGGGLSGAINANVASPTVGHRTAAPMTAVEATAINGAESRAMLPTIASAHEARRNSLPVGRAEPSSWVARTRRPTTAHQQASCSPRSLHCARSTWTTRGPWRSPPAEQSGAVAAHQASCCEQVRYSLPHGDWPEAGIRPFNGWVSSPTFAPGVPSTGAAP